MAKKFVYRSVKTSRGTLYRDRSYEISVSIDRGSREKRERERTDTEATNFCASSLGAAGKTEDSEREWGRKGEVKPS